MSTDDVSPSGPDGLAGQLDGEADFGDTTRTLYATDASIYAVRPSGVVFPRHRDDVRHVVDFARDHDVSITARGAGSSLTGNAVGEGIVLDCERYLDEIVAIDADAETVTVQPGVVLDDLNAALEPHDLYFPPDPSTSSTCTLGGMVANDAAGPHSVRHGTTRDNVRRVECVLADGSVAEFRRRDGADLRATLDRDDRLGEVHEVVTDLAAAHADEIDAKYPTVDRNSSGYDLETSASPDGEWADLSRLIVGSEGTLGVVTEVTLDLTPRPETRAAALVFYDDVYAAAGAVSPALDADPSAVELVDDAVLGYARDAWGFDIVPDAAGAALLIEVETTNADAAADLDTAVAAARTEATVSVERAVDDAAQERLWTVRKASNPLLNRRSGDEQALSFVEDAALPPARLPEYLRRVGDVLRAHDLDASVFGHAGQGVLHVKPFLNLQTEADRERLRSVSERVHEIVLEMGGCLSGEHGDGRLRSAYIREMYGAELYDAFVTVKRAFDPDDVFNPAKVVPTSDGELVAVDEQLRYEEYDPTAIETALDFSAEEGFDSLVEQCNGCSKCRTETGGVMCPSYRATGEEITSTRGRANMLRAAIDGELGPDALTSDEFESAVLDECLACKACETECPTGVDMAKLKTEVKQQKHLEDGPSLRARLFGNVRTLNRVGTALAPLANRLTEFGPGRVVAEKVLGIDRRRDLPSFATESFLEWFAARSPEPAAGERGTVALFPDCYTTYNHPDVGRATVRLLESLGYAVDVPTVDCCGRAALSQGLVETARTHAETNVATLATYADRDVPIVGVEPSCVSALAEYDDLLEYVGGVPEASRTVAGFLRDAVADGELSLPTGGDATVAFHGHCHASAKGWDAAPVELLDAVGYDVRPVDATCCGMAGAFGYETEHYDLSTTLGAELETKIDAADADLVAASGASCSQQLSDCDVVTHHPMELLAEVVA
ncbi:FAD-binding oxidoreductase [Halobellus sp. Atlit-31R]|nr:FAD-binding oxidoreductase [Halobellus sp. Atlit-31R]